ncbi:HAAS signaling domain-containing protein [Chengkuizengella axinellae]|uniref:DUF1700 domain-containing protein n=1 Tax=Chengkuizengella axinellae TaxID=3064388 RepID=A0ABT9J7X7_9BACL|nr:DUF1700 domain-containing protein [Chengkuizengella sp. 2205SS18-9]MDP5277095.1 DUF1700 domain-containing protein [Chengkuizengella sp. 2205SS18-9]
MSRNEFISQLESLLESVNQADRNEIIYDYLEHFDIGLANGKSEEELVKELGDPKVIAKDLLADYRVTKAEEDKSIGNMYKAILATFSLSFFNIVFIVGPVIGIFGAYLALSIAAVVLTISPLLLIPQVIIYGFDNIELNIFATILLCGIGILMSIGMIHTGRFLYNVTLRYIRFNIRVIKGGKAK